MRLGWLVSAGVCALVIACGGSTHKKVLVCDAAVCNPEEAGAAGTAADTRPGEAGAGGAAEGGTGPGASDAGAPGAPDAGPVDDAGEAGPPAPMATLEVTLAGNGSVAVTDAAACLAGPCQYPLTDGTLLTLEAKPAPDSRFVGWSGACMGSTPLTTVTVSGLKECNATFAIDTFTATAAVTPAAAGTASISCTPNACSAVPYGSLVNIGVTVNAGWSLVGWSAGCNAGGVTITANTACVATCRPIVTGVGAPASAGSVVVTSPGTATCVAGNPATCAVDSGSAVTLTPKPAVDSVFTGWSGDCTGSTPPYSMTSVTAPKSCTASYYQLWAQATGATRNDYMDNMVGLSDGTVVGFGTSAGGGSGTRLSLVDLAAFTGKVGRNQVFDDTTAPATAQFAAVGLAVTANQQNIIALGAHLAPGVPGAASATQYPWLHNEQAPTWEFEYKYGQGAAATIANNVAKQSTGNVITTLDGGYAFCIGGADKAVGNAAHLSKVASSGKPTWDLLFRGTDANGGIIDVTPVDVLEDPGKKYFVVLSELETTPAQLLLTYVSEAGAFMSADQYADRAHDLKPTHLVAAGTDTFLVVGSRVLTDSGDSDGFYAQLTKGDPKSARAFDVGTTSAQESFSSITRTPTGFALAGQFGDPNFGLEAWLVQLNANVAVTGQFSYGGPQAKNQLDSATTVFAMPAGGLALGGYTTSWGAGLADMWAVRLDANANITFNAGSAAHRTATTYAATAVTTLGAATPNLVTIVDTITQTAPAVAASTPNFAQNAQAP